MTAKSIQSRLERLESQARPDGSAVVVLTWRQGEDMARIEAEWRAAHPGDRSVVIVLPEGATL